MEYVVNSYPDGTHYVKVNEFSDKLTFEINSYQDLWILRQIKDVCDYNGQEVNLHIPCLLDAQADRRFNPDESSGLKLVCDFINSMKFKSVSIFHPHNPEVVEALLDNVKIIDNSDFIMEVIRHYNLHTTSTLDELILMSTDAGGFKPLIKLADKIGWQGEVYGASKSRKYVDGKSILVQEIDRQDFSGKDILIIDDICVYGGTFVGLAKMLRARNCGKLYLAVSHVTVENPNKELFVLFDEVFSTDSKEYTYLIKEIKTNKIWK
jgi:ribose-phosphate pyrophosphokinase